METQSSHYLFVFLVECLVTYWLTCRPILINVQSAKICQYILYSNTFFTLCIKIHLLKLYFDKSKTEKCYFTAQESSSHLLSSCGFWAVWIQSSKTKADMRKMTLLDSLWSSNKGLNHPQWYHINVYRPLPLFCFIEKIDQGRKMCSECCDVQYVCQYVDRVENMLFYQIRWYNWRPC